MIILGILINIISLYIIKDTPWDEPTPRSEEFVAFISRPNLDYEPWNTFSKPVLSKCSLYKCI